MLPETKNPCSPSPCGMNAICRELKGAGACICPSDYIGNPYEACRPECHQNFECLPHLACLNTKCRDPCLGACGFNAQCRVINHLPSCSCNAGFTGDPANRCDLERARKLFTKFLILLQFFLQDTFCFEFLIFNIEISTPS